MSWLLIKKLKNVVANYIKYYTDIMPIVNAAGITAFVNGHGHHQRLVERFAVHALSHPMQLLTMEPFELQDAVFESFTVYALEAGSEAVADNAETRRALGRSLCSTHIVFRNASIASDRNLARIGRAIAEFHITAGIRTYERNPRRAVIRDVLNEYWEECYACRLTDHQCDQFAKLVLSRLTRMVLGTEKIGTRLKTFQSKCKNMAKKDSI